MFDKESCVSLEFKICKLLSESEFRPYRCFWCDGIVLSENEQHYSTEAVNDNKYVYLNAWISTLKDASKESLYLLRLDFGSKALSRYANDLSIEEYLSHVCTLDTKQKLIVIQLL